MSGGIYKIVNLKNGKVYIGSAKNFDERKSRHFIDLFKKKHVNGHLQRAFNFYGASSFQFIILEQLGEYNKEIYFSNEDKWMNFYNSRNPVNGYNIAAASGGGHLGCTHSTETKKKISLSLLQNHPTRGIPLSDEHKKKISEANLGKIISLETREKNRQWQLLFNPRRGVHCSDEHKKKISKALSGERHWNFGKTTSETQKKTAQKLWTENNPRATKVSIDGVIFHTQTAACKELKISRKVMGTRLHSTDPKWNLWYIVK